MDDVLVKDILLKAAEDVQSGMWCSGAWFASRRDPQYCSEEELSSDAAFELGADAVKGKYRCAEGSIQLATVLLGGTRDDYGNALHHVNATLRERTSYNLLEAFNDCALPADPFDAGQQLAELFRSTAEAL